jgi:dolichol-phosphate mannosyltransferase
MNDKDIALSVVIPAFNERENLKELTKKIINALSENMNNFEIIIVDDGSTDGTYEMLKQLNRQDGRIKSIKLSRNFGQQVAILAGVDHAKGQAVLTMDADLQHPPELIPEMLRYLSSGYDIVYTVRRKSKGIGVRKGLFSKLFYWVFNKFTKIKLDEGSADFRLMSRRAVEAFRQIREIHRFNRGLISWMGFKHIGINYIAPARAKGKVKYNFKKNMRLALDGILSFSTFPLRFACYLGLTISFLSAIYALWLIIIKLSGAKIAPGWTQLIVTVIFFGGLQLFFIGIIGEYISRIFEETKKRPLYFIDEYAGF